MSSPPSPPRTRRVASNPAAAADSRPSGRPSAGPAKDASDRLPDADAVSVAASGPPAALAAAGGVPQEASPSASQRPKRTKRLSAAATAAAEAEAEAKAQRAATAGRTGTRAGSGIGTRTSKRKAGAADPAPNSSAAGRTSAAEKRGRGRPKGSKNKATIEKEAVAAAAAARGDPAPPKRKPGQRGKGKKTIAREEQERAASSAPTSASAGEESGAPSNAPPARLSTKLDNLPDESTYDPSGVTHVGMGHRKDLREQKFADKPAKSSKGGKPKEGGNKRKKGERAASAPNTWDDAVKRQVGRVAIEVQNLIRMVDPLESDPGAGNVEVLCAIKSTVLDNVPGRPKSGTNKSLTSPKLIILSTSRDAMNTVGNSVSSFLSKLKKLKKKKDEDKIVLKDFEDEKLEPHWLFLDSSGDTGAQAFIDGVFNRAPISHDEQDLTEALSKLGNKGKGN